VPYLASNLQHAFAEEKESIDEQLLTFTHFAQHFAQRAQAKHAESAALGERLQQQQVCLLLTWPSDLKLIQHHQCLVSKSCITLVITVYIVPQGAVAQQTQEVDNAETAAAVAVDDREAAAKKLTAAQRALEDAKGKQQHSLQVTASPSALPEVGFSHLTLDLHLSHQHGTLVFLPHAHANEQHEILCLLAGKQ